ISAMVLINPDNPSGNYIEKESVLRLSKWAEKKGITLIVDESFVDFAETKEPATLLDGEVLQNNKKLMVVKSISKSFGVPGLRLGVIATDDLELINFLKKDVAIWNINSFAEFYMQIFEKYKSDYQNAMGEFKKIRRDYITELSKIKHLRVVPTQANYVLCEVLKGSSQKLTESLLANYNIFIKDLSSKKGLDGQFIRVAVKTSEENDKLIAALKKILD
ncbi:MAG TPA: aminotransferase, partial [Firmicutes bacterium]|nr:aminotransferase [Bacillota bacterium]